MDDIEAMERCIQLAREALEMGDHPFGSVLVRDGAIFSEGRNQVNTKMDPTAHAESEAIREACKALKTLDLAGSTIYASGEPCWMCATVIRQVGIERVVIGGLSRWPTGGYSSDHPLLTLDVPGRWGPPPEVVAGVLGEECGALLDEAGWTPRAGSA
ncbi:MAG: nucleoside deaminase [Chloroflexota bacterium]